MKLFLNRKKARQYCNEQYEESFSEIDRETVVWYTDRVHRVKERLRFVFYFILASIAFIVFIFNGKSALGEVLMKLGYWRFPVFALILLAQLFVHEMIHALCLPRPFSGKSTAVFFGGPNPYVCSFSRLSATRYLFFIATPFVSMTLLSVISMIITGGFDKLILIMIFVNFSYSDLANFCIVMARVPYNAVIIGNKFYVPGGKPKRRRERIPME